MVIVIFFVFFNKIRERKKKISKKIYKFLFFIINTNPYKFYKTQLIRQYCKEINGNKYHFKFLSCLDLVN